MKQLLFLVSLIQLLTACSKETATKDDRIKDADGNIYTTVTIGTQTWLVENLKTTKFRNGDPIPHVTDFTQWKNTNAAAYCNYANNTGFGDAEGRLYNWFTVNDSRGIAPPGFHIPSREEWVTLVSFLGGESQAGGKLKEAGAGSSWTSPNTAATNESGFKAKAAGVRNTYAFATQDFMHRGILGNFWSSSGITNPSNTISAWYMHLQYDIAQGSVSFHEKTMGLSVRCVKD